MHVFYFVPKPTKFQQKGARFNFFAKSALSPNWKLHMQHLKEDNFFLDVKV